LADARTNGRERVGNRHAQVVVTMRAERYAIWIAEVFAHFGEHRHILPALHNQPYRADSGLSRRHHSGAAHLAKEVDIGLSGVSREFHFAHVLRP